MDTRAWFALKANRADPRKEKVIEPEPTMGGEDMALFLEKAKGCFFFLGVGREGGAPLHNAAFDYNEEALLTVLKPIAGLPGKC